MKAKTKVCSDCLTRKALSQFYMNNRVRLGRIIIRYRAECKDCTMKRRKMYDAFRDRY